MLRSHLPHCPVAQQRKKEQPWRFRTNPSVHRWKHANTSDPQQSCHYANNNSGIGWIRRKSETDSISGQQEERQNCRMLNVWMDCRVIPLEIPFDAEDQGNAIRMGLGTLKNKKRVLLGEQRPLRKCRWNVHKCRASCCF